MGEGRGRGRGREGGGKSEGIVSEEEAGGMIR